MADSTLDMTGEETPITTLGHGTGALGPSDSSDSGSDVVGGPGMDEGLSDDQSREMPRTIHATSGRDLGDGDLDADSDRAGTGERGASGVDDSSPNDQAVTMHSGAAVGEEGLEDPDAVAAELDGVTAGDDEGDEDSDEATERRDGLDDVPVADGAT